MEPEITEILHIKTEDCDFIMRDISTVSYPPSEDKTSGAILDKDEDYRIRKRNTAPKLNKTAKKIIGETSPATVEPIKPSNPTRIQLMQWKKQIKIFEEKRPRNFWERQKYQNLKQPSNPKSSNVVFQLPKLKLRLRKMR